MGGIAPGSKHQDADLGEKPRSKGLAHLIRSVPLNFAPRVVKVLNVPPMPRKDSQTTLLTLLHVCLQRS